MNSSVKVSHFDLKNKFRIIQTFDDNYPLVNLQLFVKIGSCWELDDNAGYSHLTEHLVFKSTKKYPNNKIMEKASMLGAAINAFTEFDSTCFYLTVPSENLKDGLEILAELVQNANFTDAEFRSEKNVVIEELKQYRNDKEDYFLEQIPLYYFKSNPYRKTIIGSEASLNSAKPQQLRDFYNHYYQPSNCFLAVTGHFDQKYLKKCINKFFNNWQNTQTIKKANYYKEILSNEFYYHNMQLKGRTQLAFVLPELSDNHPDSYPLSLLTKAFAVGKNSRLYKRLYIKDKLIDSLKVHSLSGIYDGISVILIHPRSNTSLETIIDIFLHEFKELKEHSLSLEEIDQHKKEMIVSSKYTYEYLESLGLSLCTEELLGNYHNFFLYDERIEKINSQDIKKVINLIYSYKNLSIITSGKAPINIEHLKTKYFDEKIYKAKSITEDTMHYTLPNGIKLFLKKVPGKEISGVSLALKSSQLLENSNQLGINQLSSTLLLYGNKKRSYDEFLNYCSKNGIQFGISCNKDNTKIKFKCFNDDLLDSIQLIKDVLYEPTFPKDHFQNLKKSFISTIKRMHDYPQSMAVYKWKQLLFGEHSNLISKDGQIESLNLMSLNDLYHWYNEYFLNTQAQLCIIGNIDFNEVIEKCEKIFNFSSFNQKQINYNLIIDPITEKQLVIDNQYDQSIINIGGFCCNSFEIEKKTALLVLSQIIGGEINSRLFDELREKRGLAYSTEFDFDTVDKVGYFNIFSIVDRKKELEALIAIHKILTDIKNKGVKPKELLIAKNFIKGQSRIDEEGLLTQAQLLSGLFLTGRTYEYYMNREQRLMKVNNEDIISIANEYFDLDKLITLIYK